MFVSLLFQPTDPVELNSNKIGFIFRHIRACLPSNLTRIIKIDRHDLPSFRHLSRINRIYSDTNYPKYFPNTVSSEYTCVMHAKYDILENACINNYFNTPYISWVDIGLFRHLDGTYFRDFQLVPPKYFDDSAVGFSLVWPRSNKIPVEKIMKKNLVWIAGGTVLAKTKVYL